MTEWAMSNLVWVARADIELARSTVDTPLIADADELTRVGADIIRLTLHPDRRTQGLEEDLKESPWYVDGVNEAEERLLTTLGGVRSSHRLLYEALLESYDLRTTNHHSCPWRARYAYGRLTPSPSVKAKTRCEM